jgi:GNAT superfamily N-acetyltransferase
LNPELEGFSGPCRGKEWEIMKARLAGMEDFDPWMDLVDEVRDNFPGLDSESEYATYKTTLMKNMKRGSAICVELEGRLVGVLLFSFNRKMLSCMAVHPAWRRKGIATAMIECMLGFFRPEDDIIVTTFREEDPKGTAPRALYRKFGFVEGELCEEFGYPHQRFVLRGRRE